MNIVLICTLYPPYINGGAEISTMLLAKGLRRREHKVTIITTGMKDFYEEVDGVSIYRLKNKNIYWRYPQREKPLWKKFLWHIIDIYNIFYLNSLKKLLIKIKPDIIHSGNLCGLSCIVWRIAKEQSIPIIHTLRDYYLLCPQQAMMKRGHSCERTCCVCNMFSLLKKRVSHDVDAVVGISNFILKKHEDLGYFRNAKVFCVIANSIDKKLFEQKMINNSNSLQEKKIGYIGRIAPEKGVEFLIQAYSSCKNNYSKLLIAGDGNNNYVNQLKTQYSSENVIFLGYCSVYDFLSKIDLLIVPSLWNEPFGRVVIEAYSSHTPVLIANNGGLKELVFDGISKSFETNDLSSLITLLNAYFSGELLFDNSKFDEITERFTEDFIISEYEKLYVKLKDNQLYE